MNILLIEDNLEKRERIEAIINERLQHSISHPKIYYASDLAESRRQILSRQFDFIIFDMYLPESQFNCGVTRDCSEELIAEYSKSRNYKTEAIALTQFDISELDNMRSFNTAGITVVKYDLDNNWTTSLIQKIDRVSQNVKCDFLIFCALQKERNAFRESECQIGELRKILGIDCLEIKIGSSNGYIIKPHGMGLVNMAIVTAKAIEQFQPKIVAMSGICAGVEGETNYLDIIVGKTCWEYQTGKWKDGSFKQEPYQVELERDLKIDLEQASESKNLLNEVRRDLYLNELQNLKIIVAPISSGSAVIADEEMMNQISLQHRKMAGLEMEMYSLYESAAQSLCKPLYFGAKSVVDMGGASKGDEYHEAACIVSARFVTLMLKQKLNELTN